MEKKNFWLGLVLSISAASVFYSKVHVKSRINTQIQTISDFSSKINHKYHPTLSGTPLPPLKNNNSRHTIVIGILTIEEHFDFRQAQRNSWLRDNPTIAYKFLLDKPTEKLELENSRFQDLFYLNATFSGKARGFGEKIYIWFKYETLCNSYHPPIPPHRTNPPYQPTKALPHILPLVYFQPFQIFFSF